MERGHWQEKANHKTLRRASWQRYMVTKSQVRLMASVRPGGGTLKSKREESSIGRMERSILFIYANRFKDIETGF